MFNYVFPKTVVANMGCFTGCLGNDHHRILEFCI